MDKLIYVLVRFVLGAIFHIPRYTGYFLISISAIGTRKTKMDLQVGKQFTLKASVKDKGGNPVLAVLTWVSSDPTVLTVVPDVTGMLCVVKPVGVLGVASVVATLGTLSSQPFDVTVLAGDPVSIELEAGAVEDQPSA